LPVYKCMSVEVNYPCSCQIKNLSANVFHTAELSTTLPVWRQIKCIDFSSKTKIISHKKNIYPFYLYTRVIPVTPTVKVKVARSYIHWHRSRDCSACLQFLLDSSTSHCILPFCTPQSLRTSWREAAWCGVWTSVRLLLHPNHISHGMQRRSGHSFPSNRHCATL